MQVLCSSRTWRQASNTTLVEEESVVGSSIGMRALKGIQQECEIFCCTYSVDETGTAGPVLHIQPSQRHARPVVLTWFITYCCCGVPGLADGETGYVGWKHADKR